MGIIFLVFAGLNVLYYYLVRDRIPFAAAVLEICSFVIREYMAMVWFSYVGIVMQIVWIIIWSMAAATTLYSLNSANSSSNTQGVVYFFLLVSFYWSAQGDISLSRVGLSIVLILSFNLVIKNIVHVTCAGTFASW